MINTQHQANSQAAPTDNNSAGQLDDRALIEKFIQGFIHGHPEILSNPKLRVDFVFGEIHLLSHRDGMIARVKLDAPQAGIDVRETSNYRSLIQELLIPHDIFPVGKSSTAGFARYEYRSIPEGYTLQYTEAGVLWKDRWSRGKRKPLSTSRGMSGLDAMILHRGTWYPIQSATAANGFVVIRTLGDEATLSASDFVVWLKKTECLSVEEEDKSQQHRFGARMTTVANSPTQILTGPPETPVADSNYAEEIAEDEDSTILQMNLRDSHFAEQSLSEVATDDEPTMLHVNPRHAPPPPPAAETLPAFSQTDYAEPAAPQAPAANPATDYYYPQAYTPPPPAYTAPDQPPGNYEYAASPIPAPEFHMDVNAQMALTYLQSSLAYLLQVENKSQQVHAAIRATSMAIQNLLSLLNG